MDTPKEFRVAFADRLGNPSVCKRLIIAQRVGNIAQHRKDMVPIGTKYATFFFHVRVKGLTPFFSEQLLA